MRSGGGMEGPLQFLHARARKPTIPNSLQNGSQGDFPTRGRAEPLRPNRIWLQPGLCRREGEARVNNNRGQKQVRSGVAEGI